MVSEVHPPSLCPPTSASASERRQWERIFAALMEMLRQRQGQIETLAGDRKFLQDYVLLQHNRWESKAQLLESQIAQMKKVEEMERLAYAAKLDLMLGLKQMEVSRCKELFENTESDLQDFHECVETLNREISLLKMKSSEGDMRSMSSGENQQDDGHLCSGSTEPRNWKQAYKKLSAKKEAEVTALLAEKDFVWHQFKKMEGEYTGLLKSKQVEVNQANEAAEKLQATVEKLQSSVFDKEEMISNLRADVSRMEVDLRSRTREASMNDEEVKKLQFSVREKDAMIAKLQRELARTEANSRKSSGKKMPRSSKEASLLRRSAGRSVSKGRSQGFLQAGGLRMSSKRKSLTSMPALDSPKLFSSSFKVPKLRHPSPARF
ncbi:unnamed protein product [Spirodela intermedia]|uniref:Uncharacterized protein n=1 Tax=Spirodela intermedia TaxID=51605 RepID=A0A7I8JB12_SPIIN|nr:unnamed protein product [Spirodela intermedia]CAA6667396.1 unnamed protein product [Spirodela intermedia]